MSTRRVARGSTPPPAVAHTRRRRHGRFLAPSRTISPDVIEETPPPANYRQPAPVPVRRPAREQASDDRLDALKRLEERREAANQTLYEISELETRLGIPPTPKPFPTSHRRRHARYVVDSESESEAGDDMVSFVHHERGNKPFLPLHARYRAVNVKYFKKIFFGTFMPEHLTKLAQSYMNRTVDRKDKDKNDDLHEASGLNQLLRCFEVYSQAVYCYAHPNIKLQLHEAFSNYRVRLSDMSVQYKFDSILIYNRAFMNARLLADQDDLVAWTSNNRGCNSLLIQKLPSTTTKPYENSSKSTSSPDTKALVCRNFNAGKCTFDNCKYSHTYLTCQLNHPAISCPRYTPFTSASSTNSTALGSRVIRA